MGTLIVVAFVGVWLLLMLPALFVPFMAEAAPDNERTTTSQPLRSSIGEHGVEPERAAA